MFLFMKIQACVFSVLTLLWFGPAESAQAAIKLADEQAILLGGASLPPGRGVASAAQGSSPDSAARAFDELSYTSWIGNVSEGESCWLEYRFDDDISWLVTEYTVCNGSMGAVRDPREWELQGSRDGVTWVTLDSKKQQVFAGRRWPKTYRLRPNEAYNRYRLSFPSGDANGQIELAEVGFTVKAPVLPPTEISAEAERGCTLLNWLPVESATGYTVRRSVDRGGSYVLVASGVKGTRYTDKGPFEDTDTSYYTVSSEMAAVQGAVSAPVSVSTPVAAPADLRAKLGNGLVVLEWTPSPKAAAYVVRRSLRRDGPYTAIGSLITAPAYTDEGLSAGTAYYYVVCGVAHGKEGVDTAPVSALFPPGAPTGLVAEPGKELVNLKWNAVALATGYKIMRATSADAAREEVAVVADNTAFTDKAVNFNKTYYYTVSAINDCGLSMESAVVSTSPIRPASWWRR